MHQSGKEKTVESAGYCLLNNNLHESVHMAFVPNWLEKVAEIEWTDEQKRRLLLKRR